MKKFILLGFIFAANFVFSQTAQEFRAVKITNVDSDILFDDKRIADGMNYLASIGINVILPVVWNSSGANGDYTLYPSQVMEQLFGRAIHPAFPSGRDPLKRVIIEAHRNGMEVLPWFEMGFSTSYSQNGGHILRKFPNWALQNNQGNLVVKNGFDWMSGINPDVQEFIISLVTEILDTYDVDGIEFSDRIPAMPVEGGYDLETTAIYAEEHNGASPPTNFRDVAWMRWRADKLSQFYQNVRDSIKVRSPHLLVSSSPSLYPWAYQEYLQDSKTWFDANIIDNLIPQVYRYTFPEYLAELDKSLSYIPLARRDIFFSGMLIYLKGNNYTISSEYLLNAIKANRDRNIHGEAFFFYEGLKRNRLGDTLRATFYAEDALSPHRNGNVWRPKAVIVNEDEPNAVLSGNWDLSSIPGFKPNILIKKDASYASITYFFDAPFRAWYDVFIYNVTGPLATTQAPVTIYQENDSTIVTVNQQNIYNAGWQPLASVFLTAGKHKVLKIDNKDVPAGQYVVADAAMIMINRKLSPDVIVSSVPDKQIASQSLPAQFCLHQNYPNPFNARTIIRFSLGQPNYVKLKIYDMTGRLVTDLIDGFCHAGSHEAQFYADGIASGLYLCTMEIGNLVQTRKLILLK